MGPCAFHKHLISCVLWFYIALGNAKTKDIHMKTKPDLGFWKLWNLSFGFFGVQIAYALQSAQVSRIFSTIGADPHDLSYFWILPPLMGLIIQPIIGAASDRTWTRIGRRLPYLIIGAIVGIIVMCFLPNSGSLGLGISQAIIFGLVMLMFLDTSINMAMQPFKMLVGDMVNERQKGLAYSIQSFLCNAGSVVGYVAPFVLALFLSKTAPQGEVPPTVTWSFYLGAAILLIFVVYTLMKVREWPPEKYAEYNGISSDAEKNKVQGGMFSLLIHAPKVFWTVGVTQFFCWAAFLYMWTYSTDAIAGHAFDAPVVEKATGVKINGKSYSDKYLFLGDRPIIMDGKMTVAGITVDGSFSSPRTVVVGNDTIISDGNLKYVGGVSGVRPDSQFANSGTTVSIDGVPVVVGNTAKIVSAFSLIQPGETLTLAHIAAIDHSTGKYELEQTTVLPTLTDKTSLEIETATVLNAESEEYQNAGDWNGLLLAVQGLIAVLWALVLPRFRSRRLAYSLSLAIGGLGFISIWFITSPALLFISYGLVGIAWAAMLAMPFTILTNALSGGHIGTYLGLFNCTITIPQIVAALCGGFILSFFPVAESGVTQTVWMLLVAGILLLAGALSVWCIRETYGSDTKTV